MQERDTLRAMQSSHPCRLRRPYAELVSSWRDAGPRGDRAIGQLPVCWAPSRDEAIETAHRQFRWFAGGWKVNAELPGPAGFAGATQFVRE